MKGKSSGRRRNSTLNLAAGIAGCAIASIIWTASGWRVERTSDGRFCGIEKDIKQTTGERLATATSKREACDILYKTPEDLCPSLTLSSVDKCGITNRKDSEARYGIMSFAGKNAKVPETGVDGYALSLLGKITNDIWFKVPRSVTTLINTATQESCLGVMITGGQVITAAHCLSGTNHMLKASCDDHDLLFRCRRVTPRAIWTDCMDDDVAICERTQGTSTTCSEVTSSPVQWSGPPGVKLPNQIQITMRNVLTVEVPGTVGEPWPEKGLSGVTINGFFAGGDSGGGVFDSEAANAMLLGINTCKPNAKIVPLYMWKDKLTNDLKND